MRHAATAVTISEGTVIGVCACGWVESVPRHQYVYETDGLAQVSKRLQEHIFTSSDSNSEGQS